MTVAAAKGQRATNITDAVLSALCVVGMVLVALAILREPDPRPSVTDAAPIATLAFTNAEVRRRPQGTLVWDLIGVGTQANDKDTIFVPPGTHAVFAFDDGATLEVDQNSLVVLERPARSGGEVEAPKVALVKGNLLTTAGSGGLVIETEGGQTELRAGSRASVDEDEAAGTRLDVLEGTAAVHTAAGTEEVGTAEARRFKKGSGVETLGRRSVRLESPARNARLFFSAGIEPVELSWQGGSEGMEVQVSNSRQFDEVASRGDGAKGSYAFEAPGFGAWYWRVVDANGQPVSPRRNFVLISDAPPRPSTPSATTVLAAPKEEILFAWGEVAGVRTYELQMSRKRDFSAITHQQRATGTELWIPMDFEEGVYRWRVRSVDEDRPAPPWSSTARFRLIREELPDAPELFDVEFELELEEE